MIEARPFIDDEAALVMAESVWNSLDRESRLIAFAAHPRIGDIASLRAKFASTKNWAAGEQAGVEAAGDDVLRELARQNDVYLAKFGYIFIVCATGKSATEMLDVLNSRLPNDLESELEIASEEQVKITLLRLRKLTEP